MSKPLFFFKGEARFSKKTLENCPPFRVLKAFFFFFLWVTSSPWLEEKNSFHFHSSFPPRGKRSRAFRPAFVRFPTNEATPNEKTSERRERERERADAGTIGEEEEEERI